jgi:hypothetical protein
MDKLQFYAIGVILNESAQEVSQIDGEATYHLTPESDLADEIKSLLRVALMIHGSNEKDQFFLTRNRYSEIQRVGMTDLGTSICNALKVDISIIHQNFQAFQFHPLLALVFEEAKEMDLFTHVWWIKSAISSDATMLVSSFNQFVSKIRSISNTTSFKRKIRNFERNSNENLAKFKEYISAHFARRSRLLFLRLDLGYRDAFVNLVERNVETIYRKIKSDWHKLHTDLNRKILQKNLRGFVWKLEYGLKKSFHLHVLLILDSSNLRSEITIGKIIGDHWEKTITEGQGCYFNCNAKKKSYRFCGIGQVHRDDAAMRQDLQDRVGFYLTKPDYVLCLQTPDGGRCFGKGNMPK